MTVSKIRLNGTDHDIRAKYLIQSTSSDATSAEFSARTVTEDAIANIQKIYGNTVVVSNNLVSNSATAILSTGRNLFDEDAVFGSAQNISKVDSGWSGAAGHFAAIGHVWDNIYGYGGQMCIYMKATADSSGGGFRPVFHYSDNTSSNGPVVGTSVDTYVVSSSGKVVSYIDLTYSSGRTIVIEKLCISYSDSTYDGTYEHYSEFHQIDLNIPTLTGKLNGAGSSVVIFSEGMKKAGTVYDEIVGNKSIKRVGSVDMGTLTWSMVSDASYPNRFQAAISGIAVTGNNLIPGYTNKGVGGYGSAINEDKSFNQTSSTINVHDSSYSTAASFKTAMSGVMLYYELATPEEYTLDNALQLQYPVVAGGTEMVLPTTGTAPMKMDVIYGNAADAAATMSQNYISVDSMKEFLAALGTQMGGTWSMGYENGKHTFTFTSS